MPYRADLITGTSLPLPELSVGPLNLCIELVAWSGEHNVQVEVGLSFADFIRTLERQSCDAEHTTTMVLPPPRCYRPCLRCLLSGASAEQVHWSLPAWPAPGVYKGSGLKIPTGSKLQSTLEQP